MALALCPRPEAGSAAGQQHVFKGSRVMATRAQRPFLHCHKNAFCELSGLTKLTEDSAVGTKDPPPRGATPEATSSWHNSATASAFSSTF